MIIKVSEIPDNYSCIYKINYPNGKIYIGQTNNLKRRIYEHNNFTKAKHPCDLAIKKYGKINCIEILEEISVDCLNDREIYWINYYNSNDKKIGYNLTKGGNSLRGTDSPKAIFTNEEILFIRKSRFEGKRKVDIYNNYFKHTNFNSFENVWLGNGYLDIGQEYYIPPNQKTRQYYSSIANSGENNSHAKLSKDDVIKIRERYNNGEDYLEIAKDYQFVTKQTIKRVCLKETWKNI